MKLVLRWPRSCDCVPALRSGPCRNSSALSTRKMKSTTLMPCAKLGCPSSETALLRATAAVGPARVREQQTNGVGLSMDFQEIQYHRQKTFRVVDVYGMACVGYHDRLWEAAAFPHFTIEERIALGASLSGEK